MDIGKRDIYALYRYWLIANSISTTYKQTVWSKPEFISNEGFELIIANEKIVGLMIWYSHLYVAIEGFMELGIKDPDILDLLKNEKTLNMLKILRNGVFHFQKDVNIILNDKVASFFLEKDTENWIRKINNKFEKFFVKELKIMERYDFIKRGEMKFP
jgi:hypothetical protein